MSCVLTGSIQPLLDHDRARSQPCSVDIRAQVVCAVVVSVTVRQKSPMGSDLGSLGEELLAERNQSGPAHQEASRKQDATDAQRTQTLNLSVATREALRRRLERPAHGCEGEHVADKVGQTVYRVGQECCRGLAKFPIQLPSRTHPGC
jgi:hypothetical protein